MQQQMVLDRHQAAKLVDFVLQERSKVLSMREWKHRLAGYGYAIDDTDHGPVIATLPHHREVCALPAEMSA